MGIRTVVECDVCGKQKQETNHWYASSLCPENELIIIPLHIAESMEIARYQIICGEACVIKFVSQNLAALHPPKAPLTAPVAEQDQQTLVKYESCLCNGVGCNRCEPQGRG